jgi:biotin carboxyl carrier protein
MPHTYEYNGQSHAITLEKQPDGTFTATINGRSIVFTAQPLDAGRWLIQLGQRQIVAYIETSGEARYVQVDGERFTLNAVNPQAQRRRTGTAAGGDLTAQMPGQVREVRVSEGDAVQAGDTLVVLEAMKMEIRVSAPADGTVKKLHVKTGDVVERGQRLIELAEA